MKVFKTARLAIATCVLVAAGSSFASAEIVFMTSGGTVSVKKHANFGESVVLTLRSGGEVTLDKTLIDKIVPDEVEHPEPAAPAAEQEPAVPAGPAAKPGSGLRETAYAELIMAAAEAHGVNPTLVQALIQVESNYQPRARSNKGAMGLMQLMPSTAREYKVRNAYDPATNIAAGVQKLKGLIDTFGSTALALAAYNAGEAAVLKFNGIPPYRETQSYVSRILSISGLK
jgi:soluble lytic murein transglycosylase-like protein